MTGKRNAKAYQVDHVPSGTPLAAGAYFFMYDIYWDEKERKAIFSDKAVGIQHGCPFGCGKWSTLFFAEQQSKSAIRQDGWKIIKPFPEASLEPSIGLWRGQNPYHWHGYLTDGVFTER